MKKLLSIVLFFVAAVLFVLGHTTQLMVTLHLAFWLCTLFYLHSKNNMTRFSKSALGALISIGFALVAFMIAKYLHPNADIDFLLVGIVSAGFGWFFEDLSKST